MNGYVAKSDVLNVIRILQSKMDDSGARALENVNSAVEDMVEADVVPVVRCRDCKYWQKDLFGNRWCKGIERKNGDWFCADGMEKVTE